MATETTPQLDNLSPLPDRKLPQSRYDAAVKVSMISLVTFTLQMNNNVIPWINTQVRTTATNASTASTKATEAANSASAASTSANNAVNSATTASTKAEEAATSANKAEESADTARIKAGEATTSAQTATNKAQTAENSANDAQQSAQSAAASLTAAREAVADAQEQLRIVQEAQATINRLAAEAQSTLDACVGRLNSINTVIDTKVASEAAAREAADAAIEDRLTQRISADELSYTHQTAALSLASLQQSERITATETRLDGRVDVLTEDTATNFAQRDADAFLFHLGMMEHIARLSWCSIMQSYRLARQVIAETMPRRIDSWVNDEDGQQFDFSTMHFSSDDGSVVLPGAGLIFDPD